MSYYSKYGIKPKKTELTQKEFNVAYLYAFGHSVKKTANANKITYAATWSRLKMVYIKLGINNRLDLARWFETQPI